MFQFAAYFLWMFVVKKEMMENTFWGGESAAW